MATSRFMQAVLRALDHTVETNPGCVCSINFKKSGIWSYSKMVDIPKKYQVTIKVTEPTVEPMAHKNTTEIVYFIHKIHQRWWYTIFQGEDEFIEISK